MSAPVGGKRFDRREVLIVPAGSPIGTPTIRAPDDFVLQAVLQTEVGAAPPKRFTGASNRPNLAAMIFNVIPTNPGRKAIMRIETRPPPPADRTTRNAAPGFPSPGRTAGR
jgi:hypothetical protein